MRDLLLATFTFVSVMLGTKMTLDFYGYYRTDRLSATGKKLFSIPSEVWLVLWIGLAVVVKATQVVYPPTTNLIY